MKDEAASSSIVYRNGKKIDGELSVDFLNTETAGVFETMRVYRGRIFREQEHLDRLMASAKTIGYRPLPQIAALRRELKKTLKDFGEQECFVRLTLCEGRSFIFINSRHIAQELYQKGVALKTASFSRGGPNTFPWQAKTSAYQQAILATVEPQTDDIYEWVFLNQQNFLTETRVGNFFLVKYPFQDPVLSATLPWTDLSFGREWGKTGSWNIKKAMLLTPPEHLILNGVTRRFVIKCALELGMQVREIPLTRHEFFNADEAFLSNTSWEILPIRELDGRVIGAGKPGPMTLKLHRYFKRRVQQDVAPRRSPSLDQRF